MVLVPMVSDICLIVVCTLLNSTAVVFASFNSFLSASAARFFVELKRVSRTLRKPIKTAAD